MTSSWLQILLNISVIFVATSVSAPVQALASVAPKVVSVGISLLAPLTHHAKSIAADDIVRLASLGQKTGGTKEIGKILGAKNLPNEVLEDAYVRIAIQQGRISRTEADGMFRRLRNTPGFRSTVSKIVGNSEIKTAGHLNELRIADSAAENGFQVKGIGVRFDDGMKSAQTDIDILLFKNDRVVAIEAKDYLPTTPIPLDKFRADMDSLVEYSRKNPSSKVLNVFSITNRPADMASWNLLQKEAERRGVELIEGTPNQQIVLIKQLVTDK